MFTSRTNRMLLLIGLSILLGLALGACNLSEVYRSFGEEVVRICAQEELVVNTTEDSNDAVCNDVSCSLREAVIDANACDSDQTIVIPSGTYELTRHGTGENIARSGDLDITVPVTIRGEGNPVVDGQGAVRVFDVRLEEVDRVVFQGLTIRNGFAEGSGAGIRVERGAVELENVVVTGNQAGTGDAPGSGGGVFVRNGSLSLVASEVRENTAYGQGGGLFFDRGTRFGIDTDSIIADNGALDNYGGGGIYSRGEGNLSGEISGNQAAWAGGGVHNSGQLTIRSASVRNNRSETGGGGVSNSGQLEIRNSSFLGNSADDGAGLISYGNLDSAGAPRVSILDSSFGANTAGRAGGGVFNDADSLMIGTRVELDRNEAQRGAGLFNMGEAVLLQSTVDGNRAGGVEGGGVWTGGTLSITGSTLSNNVAAGTSGVYLGGSAIWIDSGGVSILNSTLSGNELLGGRGGALFNRGGNVQGAHLTVANHLTPAFAGISGSVDNIALRASIVVENGEDVSCIDSITSDGFNLFDNPDCGPDTDLGDILLEPGDDPGLTSLNDHGGSTFTHALLADSPAMDAVEEGCPSPEQDQRGVARPDDDGGLCDIGAFEAIGGERSVGAATATPGATPLAGEIDVNFNADVYTIERGECTTLRWQVSGASRIQLLGQIVEDTGAEQVCPGETTGYTLFAENDADEVSEYLEIAVTEPTDDRAKGCEVYDQQTQQYVCQVPCQQDNPEQYPVCYK